MRPWRGKLGACCFEMLPAKAFVFMSRAAELYRRRSCPRPRRDGTRAHICALPRLGNITWEYLDSCCCFRSLQGCLDHYSRSSKSTRALTSIRASIRAWGAMHCPDRMVPAPRPESLVAPSDQPEFAETVRAARSGHSSRSLALSQAVVGARCVLGLACDRREAAGSGGALAIGWKLGDIPHAAFWRSLMSDRLMPDTQNLRGARVRYL